MCCEEVARRSGKGSIIAAVILSRKLKDNNGADGCFWQNVSVGCITERSALVKCVGCCCESRIAVSICLGEQRQTRMISHAPTQIATGYFLVKINGTVVINGAVKVKTGTCNLKQTS